MIWNRWTRPFVESISICCFLALIIGPFAHAQDPPHYKVDPNWPKQLPKNWILGGVPGMFVDKEDHIWVLHRPGDITADEALAAQIPPRGDCCVPAPAVLEFDTDGNLLKAWGGPGTLPDWPGSQGILVDKEGNVWLGGAGAGDAILKLTNDGRLIKEIVQRSTGTQQQDNQDTTFRGRAAGFDLDEGAHELYLADGFLNRRVIVLDSDSGTFKRGWGAYGIPLSQIDNSPSPVYDPSGPPSKQFTIPVHCIHISADGLVYVCDRGNDRIQVFTKQGKFVQEFFLHRETPASGPKCGRGQFPCGTSWNLSFSPDPKEK